MPKTGLFLWSCVLAILNMNKLFVPYQIAPNFPFHVIVFFIVPVLLNLLQLKHQGNASDSVFEEHPITARFTAGCLLVYCLGYAIEMAKLSGDATFVYRFNLLFASLFVASLASMIFPSSIFRIFLYGICIIVSVDLQHLFNKIETFINRFMPPLGVDFFVQLWPMRNREDILPVFNRN